MSKIIESFVSHAAFPAVFSAMVTLVLANLFELAKRKSLEKQMFFEHFFKERIKAYNELLEKLPEVVEDLAKVPPLPPSSRPKALVKIVNKMNKKWFTQNLWFERRVVDMLTATSDVIRLAIFRNETAPVEEIGDEELHVIMISFMKSVALLNKVIEFSSGTKLLDKKFYQLTKPSFIQKIVSFIRRDKKKGNKILKGVLSADWTFFNPETEK